MAGTGSSFGAEGIGRELDQIARALRGRSARNWSRLLTRLGNVEAMARAILDGDAEEAVLARVEALRRAAHRRFAAEAAAEDRRAEIRFGYLAGLLADTEARIAGIAPVDGRRPEPRLRAEAAILAGLGAALASNRPLGPVRRAKLEARLATCRARLAEAERAARPQKPAARPILLAGPGDDPVVMLVSFHGPAARRRAEAWLAGGPRRVAS